MIRSSILFCLLLTTTTVLKAQIPTNVVTTDVANRADGIDNATMMDCSTMYGGDITLDTINLSTQSNDIDLEVSYLCFGDAFNIFNTNSDVSGDPEPLTDPGIGYIFYDCPPTIDGPTKADILLDPCLNQTDPIFPNTTPIPLDDFWITRDSINGDFTFSNTGVLQEAYNNNAPVQFWFAPITLHDFENGGFEDGETSCLNVNIDQAFSIVYLNEITVSNLQTSVNGNNCQGSFVVEGGLPEFDGLTYSSFSIYKTDNPEITGTLAPLSVSNAHGDEVVFSVAQPGNYTIEIFDDKGCMTSFTMDMTACPPLILYISDEAANPGQDFCYEVTTEDFTDVLSMQFSLGYDETLLQFNEATNFAALEGLDAGSFSSSPGTISLSWFDPNTFGQSVQDGTVIFELCFTVIGTGIFDTQLAQSGTTPPEVVDALGNPIGLTINPGTLTSFSELDVTTSVDSVSCGGASDGSFSLEVSGGIAPYNVVWENIAIGTPNMIMINNDGGTATVPGLPAGMYSITVTDMSIPAFQFTTTVTIEEAPAIFFDISVNTNLTCAGDSDGIMDVSLLGGGTPPYTIDWSTGFSEVINSANDATPITGLSQGPYSATITDQNGCQQPASGAIGINPVQINVVDIDHVSCQGNGNDGMITVAATGGTGVITFEWDNGVNGPTITDLAAGEYNVVATDENDCSATTPIIVNAPELPVITAFDDAMVSCPSSTDGSLTVVAQEANSPIATYSWSPNVSSSATANNLTAGTYVVTVTAEDGCIAIDSAMVIAPEPLSIADTLITIPTCPGTDIPATGIIGLTMAGGTPPYTFFWDNGATTGTIPSLYGGQDYCVTITDANQCPPLEACIFLPEPPSIFVDFTNQQDVSCFDGSGNCITSNGQATAVPSGGTGDGTYTFIWSSGETTGTATGLCQGIQTVTISDNICFIVDSVFIGAPSPVSIQSFDNQDPSCFGLTDGSISVMATGGTPPFNFTWNTGATGATLENIGEGNYMVTATDVNNCIGTLNVSDQIVQPPQLIVEILEDNTFDVSCNDGLDGQIVVTNPIVSDTIITQDTSFVVTTIFHGTPPLQYTWTDSVSTTDAAVNLPVGLYGVTVTDANGCEDEVSHVISQPPAIVPFIPEPEEPICFGLRTVITVDTAVGGNGELYTFSVNGGPRQTRGNLVRVPGGREHEIRVFDGADCYVDTTIYIGEPAPVSVDLGPDVEIQLGDSIRLQPSLFVPLSIDSIIWSPLTDLNCNNSSDCLRPFVSPLESTPYRLTIVDANGCQGTDEILVKVDKNRNVFIPNIFSPNGDGFNDIFRVHVGPGVRNINYMRVFDRWGEILFSNSNFLPSDNFSFGWDGRMNGKILNPGVFVYLIEVTFDDGVTLLYRGDVTLIY